MSTGAKCSVARAVDRQDEGLRLEVLRQVGHLIDWYDGDTLKVLERTFQWVKNGEVE
ncbi:hypothetical protein SEA_NANOSMITE_60 [Mycobacterium phage Nanosmite]|nr:hypothetical protein SEA_NANOSMITE_60 [Mycobacterium phage Nanosmite]